jgi:glycosyltransferase involved in cell wall biosynthesis
MEQVHAVDLGFGGQRDALEALAREPRFGGRLHVLPPVPPAELLGWVRGADVDAMPLQRTTLNHYLCTPNKLFESLAAGVPVVVSDFPVMRRIALDDPAGALGTVCDPASPGSIARAVAAILGRDPAERAALRARCLEAAHERWNWERESAELLGLYAELTSTG